MREILFFLGGALSVPALCIAAEWLVKVFSKMEKPSRNYPVCQDCKHAEWVCNVFRGAPIDGGNWFCRGCRDFVDGHFNICQYNRENQAICGREARFFEERDDAGREAREPDK